MKMITLTTAILLALLKHLLVGTVSQFLDYDDMLEEKTENCVCVPYWQCKDDFSGLVQDGIDIMDIRNMDSLLPCTGEFDVCCQVGCGRKNNGFLSRSRILGSTEETVADFGEFPWMLGILQDGIFICGGSLIHQQVAVTAAHCVSPLERYMVRAGEWNWETKREPLTHQDRFSKIIVIHSLYDATALHYDIALLILEKPFQLTQNIGIICISRHRFFGSEKCIASGWGKNSSKKGATYQSTLKKVMVPIVPNYQCAQTLRKEVYPYFKLHRSFVCAGGEPNKDTCKGDGGGPLVCPFPGDPNRFHQVGIVSWGLTCGVRQAPGVYVNVGLFSDWIDTQMLHYNFDTRAYKIDS